MSKASRARARDKRSKEKLSRKRAKKALYESYARAGANSKSKRFTKKGQRKLLTGASHPEGVKCGNPACRRCYGINFSNFLRKNGTPLRMPQWMYFAWKKLGSVSSAE